MHWQKVIVVDKKQTVEKAFRGLQSPLELDLSFLAGNIYRISPVLRAGQWETVREELQRLAQALSMDCRSALAWYWDSFAGSWTRLYESGRLVHEVNWGAVDKAEILIAMGASESLANLDFDLDGNYASYRLDEDERYPPGALHRAAARGHAEKVRRLLASADVNERNPEGRTPLSYAASHGQIEVVRMLLAAGADIHAHPAGSWDWDVYTHPNETWDWDWDKEAFEGYWGRNALFHAAKSLATLKPARPEALDALHQIVDLLAAEGCSLDAAAPYLAKAGRDDLLKHVNRSALNGLDDLGNSALITALLLHQVERVQYLLELGADPNAANAFGNLPLVCVDESAPGLELARRLIERGADANAWLSPRRHWRRFDAGGSLSDVVHGQAVLTVLDYALRLQQAEKARLLVEAGGTAPPDQRYGA